MRTKSRQIGHEGKSNLHSRHQRKELRGFDLDGSVIAVFLSYVILCLTRAHTEQGATLTQDSFK